MISRWLKNHFSTETATEGDCALIGISLQDYQYPIKIAGKAATRLNLLLLSLVLEYLKQLQKPMVLF